MAKPSSCFAFLFLLLATHFAFAQGYESRPFSRLGIGIKMSLLGAGVEAATPLTQRSNLRVGFNAFDYQRNSLKDGVNYGGRLNFRSVEAHYDWFPFGSSFHISPGVLAYNGNQVTANASVPGGQTFTLNGTTYSSDPADPVGGSGKIVFYRAGPMLSAGFGNLLPRNHRHFSIPFEVGAVYTGSPHASLNLTGSACDAGGLNCQAISSDPTVQANIQAEKSKLNKEMSPYRFYPVISVGFGVNF